MVLLCATSAGATAPAVQFQSKSGPLTTRWAAKVDPKNPLPEYPRPQMVRKEWLSLNGIWDFAITKDGKRPEVHTDQICVPFPVESALSGVMRKVEPGDTVCYRRQFVVPPGWRGQTIMLRFGAVDWDSTVYVNGKQLIRHKGGYDPFAVDVTPALTGSGPQEIVVEVKDPSDRGEQARGKQVLEPHGILYTPSTGIWQTVWLEPVPKIHIDTLRLTPSLAKKSLSINCQLSGKLAGLTLLAEVISGSRRVAVAEGKPESLRIDLRSPRAWTPNKPFLYGLRLTLKRGKKVVDQIESYFGMRDIALAKGPDGVLRTYLNGEPIFMCGPLDQGFWPDGLYTAPTDEALRFDIEATKQYGFNTARKHVKVEPSRWYYWCDKLGLLVWQDMPSKWNDSSKQSREVAKQFEGELEAMLKALHNHPSIVMWVPFNEGWGQYDTERITKWVKRLDPNRLVNNASGWTDMKVGDVIDWHNYPGPTAPLPEAKRASVLGEFGGLGLPVKGHMWKDDGNWGYVGYKTQEEVTTHAADLFRALRPLQSDPGLSAAIYTQTTDCEIEVNGLLTYDREVFKVDPKVIRPLVRDLYKDPPLVREVVPSSRRGPTTWRYTLEQPGPGWAARAFDDSRWTVGEGGFGREGTPGSVIRTKWTEPAIWLRREIVIPESYEWYRPFLQIHHDEDAEVYIDGQMVANLSGYSTGYRLVPLPFGPRPGKHLLALHCRQTDGGQYVDAGIVDVRPSK